MKKIILPFSFVLAAMFLTYCGSKKTVAALSNEDVDSINQVVIILQDSLAATWKIMEDEEQLKLTYLKRIIDEISYTNVYDKPTYDSLDTQIAQLKAMRYNQQTMSKSSLIDDYDVFSSQTITAVIEFAEKHPRLDEYPIINELIDDIMEIDHKVIYRRVDYDNIADEYNKYIESNNATLISSGKNVSKKSLFRLE